MSMTDSTQKLNGIKKILLADHHSNNRQHNLSLLKRAGYNVDLVDDSKHIIAKLTAGNVYDIILIDLSFFDKITLNLVQHNADGVTNKHKWVVLISDVLSHTIALDFYNMGLNVMRNPLSAAHIAELLELE